MVNWGDVPTWIQAGATVLLLIAASVAGWYTHRIYKIESGRDERHEDERRAQASKVAGWVVGNVTKLRNASDLPVYDLIVEYVARYERNREPVPIGMQKTPLLVPGEEPMFVPSQVWDKWREAPKKEGAAVLVRIDFRDSSGQRWRREHDGRLQDLDATSGASGEGPLQRWGRRIRHPVRAVRTWRRR